MSKHKKRNKIDLLKAEINQELREHPVSFWIFSVLRILALASLVRQFFLQNYEGMFFCILTVVLLYLPSWFQVQFRIELPPLLESTILCFIFAAEILGEVNAFYVNIPGWDTMLHTFNGFLCAAVGFSLITLLNDNQKVSFDLSPLFLALVAFCFSMTIGVLWEFFEFSMDWFFHSDMQKDTIVNAIYSTTLDLSRSNLVESVPGITETAVNGQILPINGYLDIGLIDTMKDLMVNFIGAAVFSVTGFFYAKTKSRGKALVQGFVPSPKSKKTEHDAVQTEFPETDSEHDRLDTKE